MPEGFSIAESLGVVVDGLKAVMSLCTEFPLNFYLASGLLGLGLGLFKFFKRR